MDTFHGIHIPGVTRAQVLDALDQHFFQRYFTRRETPSAQQTTWGLAVSDELDGWVSVYDEGQNFRRANKLAMGLSQILHGPVLWLGLFEDLDFYYQLFHDGKAMDAYDSDPSIFDPEEGYLDDPWGTGWLPADFSDVDRDRDLAVLGKPQVFFSVLSENGDLARETRLQELLNRGRAYHDEAAAFSERSFSWPDEGVPALAELLGIPLARAVAGYDKLQAAGDLPAWLEPLIYREVARASHAVRGRGGARE